MDLQRAAGGAENNPGGSGPEMEIAMKQDLDRLMTDRNLDALWITGPANHNPAMVYFTGVTNITRADLIKKRNEPPVLFHYPMEREEATRTGLRCRNYNDFKLDQIIREAGGSTVRAGAIRIARVFRELGVRGRVAVGGTVELSAAFAVLADLPSQALDIQLVGDGGDSAVSRARATKSAEEIAHIRSIGLATTAVIGETAEFLSSHTSGGDCVVGRDGDPLTIGQVKAFIRRKLAERGGESPEGLIFAQGRDAGIPHSSGNDEGPVRLGVPIVFDFFPCETGGGYFYDITRTWCLGHAPEDVEQLYEQVLRAYTEAREKYRPGVPAKEVQLFVCRLFESMGHPTVRSDPQTEQGYVHTLGHGLGLDVHESPYFSHAESNPDVLQPGAVFTLEPGLYYPERNMGVRLEDTLWMQPSGAVEVIAPYPLDLILPVRRGSKNRIASKRKTAARTAPKSGRLPARRRKKIDRPERKTR
jgi:Xaa-Pro aminopeptidase